MTLNDLISRLTVLAVNGHGPKQVFYRHMSSGDSGEVYSVHVTNVVDSDTGPFDLADGEKYIALSVGGN